GLRSANPPYEAALLRRELPWRWRRAGEIGDQLGVAFPDLGGGLLLHRTVAADAIRQRQQFEGGLRCDRRQRSEHGCDILFIGRDQLALELAVGAARKNVERGAAQEAEFRQHAEHRQHPRTKRALERPPQRILAPAEDRRRQVEVELEVAFELIA